MKPVTSYSRLAQLATIATLGVWILGPTVVVAQTPASTDPAHSHAQSANGQSGAASGQDQQLAKQIEELRAQVAKLQAALDQQRQPTQKPMPAPTTQKPGMGEMGMMGGMPKGEMGAMPQGGMGKGEMGGMSGGGMGMMDMHKGEMGMPPDGMKMPEGMMMGEMGRMGGMPGGSAASSGSGTAMGGGATGAGMAAGGGMTMGGRGSATTAARPGASPRSMSSLPGVPGASHLYHVGSTGFFLDQSQMTLSNDQKTSLNRIKEAALLGRGNAERRIEQAEQELWALTGADQPDAAKVEAKTREIEQLRANERLAFIRAVGEATKLLTPEQRNALLGTPSSPKK